MATAARSLGVAVLLLLCCALGALAVGDHASSRPLTSFSFQPPFFPEAGSVAVPGWEVKGSTVVHEDFIRLTPDTGHMSGYITNRRPFFMNTVELTLAFKIHSDTPGGADGMALWLVDQPIKPGTCFGASDTWNGLAIFLDTYDNNMNGDNPRISVHRNDGTYSFDFASDGRPTELGGCSANFHNSEKGYLHLYYEHGTLNLFVDPTGTGAWERCMEPQTIELPKRFFYGISAATGGYSDFHDVISLHVNTMDAKFANNPNSVQDNMPRPPLEVSNPELAKAVEEEKKRLGAEAGQAGANTAGGIPGDTGAVPAQAGAVEEPLVLVQPTPTPAPQVVAGSPGADAVSPPGVANPVANPFVAAEAIAEQEAEHKRLDELEERLNQQADELEQQKAEFERERAKNAEACEGGAPAPFLSAEDMRLALAPSMEDLKKELNTATTNLQANINGVAASVRGASISSNSGDTAAKLDSLQQYMASTKKELLEGFSMLHESIDSLNSRLMRMEDAVDPVGKPAGGDNLKEIQSLQNSVAQMQRTLSQMQIEQRKMSNNVGFDGFNSMAKASKNIDWSLLLYVAGALAGMVGLLLVAFCVYAFCKPKPRGNPRLF